MNRAEFIELRDTPNKRILKDIALRRKKVRSVVYTSGAIPIEVEGDVLAYIHIEYNEATDAKTVNVMLVGVGPVCRLDVDGKVHRPAGRSHNTLSKHQSARRTTFLAG
jgi:hypothetical protein